MISGLPRAVVIKGDEVRDALKEPVGQIVDAVLTTLEQIEPELAADLVDNGIHMAGGGSLLRGLDQVLSKATGLNVKVVDDPLTAVARGTSEYLDYLDDWHPTLESDEDEY
jgi:rod shape-determining protein MreB